jgi:hypothetical protein
MFAFPAAIRSFEFERGIDNKRSTNNEETPMIRRNMHVVLLAAVLARNISHSGDERAVFQAASSERPTNENVGT